MPFEPAKPADGSPLESAKMRTQLAALNDDTQTRSTVAPSEKKVMDELPCSKADWMCQN